MTNSSDQHSLFDYFDIPLKVTAVLNEGVESASRPKVVLAEDGHEYFIKCDSYSAEHGCIMPAFSQELLMYRLATHLELPVPNAAIIDFEHNYWFGSRRLENRFPSFRPEHLSRVANPEVVHAIAAFDTWVLNRDRHEGNFLFHPSREGLTLMIIDHGWCPIHGGHRPGSLASDKDIPVRACVRPVVLACLTQPRLIRKAIDAIQTIDTTWIESMVLSNSRSVWTSDEKRMIIDLLLYRQRHLLSFFQPSIESLLQEGW